MQNLNHDHDLSQFAIDDYIEQTNFETLTEADGITAVMLATGLKDAKSKSLEKLLQSKARFSEPMLTGVLAGLTPLQFAVIIDHGAAVKCLVTAGADKNTPAKIQKQQSNMPFVGIKPVDSKRIHDFLKMQKLINYANACRALIAKEPDEIQAKLDKIHDKTPVAAALYLQNYSVLAGLIDDNVTIDWPENFDKEKLILAAIQLGVESLQACLKLCGFKPDMCFKDDARYGGLPLLFAAAESGNVEVMEFLAENTPENLRNILASSGVLRGKTPLVVAIEKKDEQVALSLVKYLTTEQCKMKITNDYAKNEVTVPFLLAGEYQLWKLVETLVLEKGIDYKSVLKAKDDVNVMLVFPLVEMGQLDLVKRFIQQDEYINAIEKDNDNKGSKGMTFLLKIMMCHFNAKDSNIKKNYNKIFSFLLAKKGIDINFSAKEGANEGMTPLMCALMNKSILHVALLVERGADVSTKFEKGEYKTLTPLAVAIDTNIERLVTLLLDNGADPNQVFIPYIDIANKKRNASVEITPLIAALSLESHKKKPEPFMAIVRALIAAGANVYTPARVVKDKSMYSFDAGHFKCLLIKTDLQKPGVTPIFIAAMLGNTEIVELIIKEQLAEQNLQLGPLRGIEKDNKYYRVTPLHAAVSGNHIETVKLLLKYGASLTAKDKSEETVIDRAKNQKNKELLDLLLSYTKPKEEKKSREKSNKTNSGSPNDDKVNSLMALSLGFGRWSYTNNSYQYRLDEDLINVPLDDVTVTITPEKFLEYLRKGLTNTFTGISIRQCDGKGFILGKIALDIPRKKINAISKQLRSIIIQDNKPITPTEGSDDEQVKFIEEPEEKEPTSRKQPLTETKQAKKERRKQKRLTDFTEKNSYDPTFLGQSYSYVSDQHNEIIELEDKSSTEKTEVQKPALQPYYTIFQYPKEMYKRQIAETLELGNSIFTFSAGDIDKKEKILSDLIKNYAKDLVELRGAMSFNSFVCAIAWYLMRLFEAICQYDQFLRIELNKLGILNIETATKLREWFRHSFHVIISNENKRKQLITFYNFICAKILHGFGKVDISAISIIDLKLELLNSTEFFKEFNAEKKQKREISADDFCRQVEASFMRLTKAANAIDKNDQSHLVVICNLAACFKEIDLLGELFLRMESSDREKLKNDVSLFELLRKAANLHAPIGHTIYITNKDDKSLQTLEKKKVVIVYQIAQAARKFLEDIKGDKLTYLQTIFQQQQTNDIIFNFGQPPSRQCRY